MCNYSQFGRTTVQTPEVLFTIPRMRKEALVLAFEIRSWIGSGRWCRSCCRGCSTSGSCILFVSGRCWGWLLLHNRWSPWTILAPGRWFTGRNHWHWFLRCSSRFGFQEVSRAVDENLNKLISHLHTFCFRSNISCCKGNFSWKIAKGERYSL